MNNIKSETLADLIKEVNQKRIESEKEYHKSWSTANGNIPCPVWLKAGIKAKMDCWQQFQQILLGIEENNINKTTTKNNC